MARWLLATPLLATVAAALLAVRGDSPPSRRALDLPPAPPRASDSAAPHVLRGRVVAAERPVEGARILAHALCGGASAEARADALGRFAFAPPRAGALALDVSAPGFATRRVRVEADEAREIELELALELPIEGAIVGEGGGGLAGGRVSVRLRTLGPDSEVPTAVADEAGRFRLAGTTRGVVYRLRAEAAGHAPLERDVTAHTGDPFYLVLGRAGSVAGTVRNRDGTPRPHARVRIETDPGNGAECVADAAGRYRLDGLDSVIPCLTRIDGVCAIPPAAGIPPGDVLAFDPVHPGTAVIAGRAEGARAVVLQSEGDDGVATSPVGSDGAFRFDGVPPGRHFLHPYPGARCVSPPVDVAELDLVAVAVAPGDAVDDVRIVAAPAATLVVDAGPSRRFAELTLRVRFFELREQADASGVATFVDVPPNALARVRVADRLIAVAVLAPGEHGRVEAPETRRGAFRGVVELPDGGPAAGATVVALDESGTDWLLALAGPDETCDANGRFEIPLDAHESGEKWAIVASHDRFACGVLRGLPRPLPDEPSEVRVRLARGVEVAGVVLDPEGRPAAGAYVVLESWEEIAVVLECRPSVGSLLDEGPPRERRASATDSHGRFRLHGLHPGGYLASASHPRGSRGAQWVDAPCGAVLLRLAPNRRLRGVVLDESGQRLGGVSLSCVGGTFDLGVTDASGRFEIGDLSPEALPLRFEVGLFYDGPGFEPAEIRSLPDGDAPLVVRVRAGRRVEGRVLDERGRPVPDVLVRVLPEPERLAKAPANAYTPHARTDRDGGFQLRGLDAVPVEIATVREGLLPDVVTAAADGARVELRLRDGFRIEGSVLAPDGSPVPLHEIVLRHAGGGGDLRYWSRSVGRAPSFPVRTDLSGRFRAIGLPAGEYEVLGPHELPLARARTGETAVTVRLPRILTIAGRLVDTHGAPAANDGERPLFVAAKRDGRWIATARAEADGTFLLEDVPEGRYTLESSGHPRYESATMEAEAGSADVRIVLPSRK